MRFLILLFLGVFAFVPVASAQDALTNWRGARVALDRDLASDLQELAGWCRAVGLADQVEATFALYRPRDLQRLYIFPPSEKATPATTDDRLGQWQAKLNEIKRAHATRVFELAQRAAAIGAGGDAYQLLHEVLHLDPDRADVRRMLAHRKTDDGWRVASEKITVRPARKPHPQFGWPARSYLVVKTPFFEIESTAPEARTVKLAENLERWHAIWRQVFFDYWSNARVVQKLFDSGSASLKLPRKRRFHVVFFKDQQQYATELSKFVRGAAGSSGYYSSNDRTSYFPDGDTRAEDTWRHELTHQLFRESVRTRGEPFEERFIWLDEGIATWFESLADFGDYVTLGGFDSRRTQYARVRKFNEGFYIPLAELTTLGRLGLQSHPDMVRIYSQAAGVADMLMNDDAGAMARGVTDVLRLIYLGKLKPGKFEALVGKSWGELDARYPKFLAADATQVAKHLTQPLTRTELSLPNAKLDSSAFQAIGRCHHLEWLDVSRNHITADHIRSLKNCQQLSQLFMVGSRIDADAFGELTTLSELSELELSGSNLNDGHLATIARLPTLTRLTVRATSISDAGIAQLTALRGLRELDVSKTAVSATALQWLQQSIPNLQVTQ